MIEAVIFGIINAARGGGYLPRIMAAILMGTAYFVINFDLLSSAIVAIGLYLALLPGWGKGLASITGRYPYYEKDFWPADKVGDWLHDKTNNGFAAGTAFMTVRGLLFYLPFAGLQLWMEGLCVILFGLIYYISGKVIGEKNGTRLAEFASLAWIGFWL